MPPRSFGALLALVALLVVAPPVAGVSSHSTGAGTAPLLTTAPQAATSTPVPPTETRRPSQLTMHVAVQPDGDARWRVSATFPFRNANDTAGFTDLVTAFENDDEPLGFEAYKLALDRASAATGREMEFRNVTKTHDQTASAGTLTLGFTWSNFARTDGDRLSVGDAFNTTDGTWLPSLSDDQVLVVAPPEDYGVVNAPEVGIVDGKARWDGPHVFEGREPWIAYSGDASTPRPPTLTTAPGGNGTATGTPGSATPTTEPGTDAPNGFFSSALPIATLVVVAGASAAVLAVYMRRDDGDFDGTAPESGDGDAPSTEPAGSDPRPPGPAADATEDVSSGSTAAGDEGADDTDEALLSDEERVERLLERNGGRMKQANIVKETGWSNAKVSQLLSAMDDDDRIDKLRIGRENLISFPDEDVTDLGDE